MTSIRTHVELWTSIPRFYLQVTYRDSLMSGKPRQAFLATAALGASPDRLLNDLEFLGFLFESMVYRDLSIYAGAHDAEVYHYRDNTNLEVDMVVQTRKGDWSAFDVKLGGGQVDAAANSLKKFRERLDCSALGESGTLGVIVGSGYGYMRPDGIAVIPISSLGP